MKRRIFSFLMVLCIVLSSLPTTAFAATENTGVTSKPVNPFTDVHETDWFYDAVQYALANGFFNGTSPTTFDPNGTMTRGMFVTILGRMAGVDISEYSGISVFSDVPVNQYYAPYVAWASKHGIANGVGNGKFVPNGLVNREQMATFLVRYFEIFGVDYETGANITTIPADIDKVSDFAKDAVLKLWKQGLLNGDGVNFNPSGNASRAEAATLCQRADKAVETWYKEPGVPSDRISVDPSTGESGQPNNGGGSSGGGNSGGSPSTPGETQTTYYEVTFALGNGQNGEGVVLPSNKLYASGTKISAIPTPYQPNGIFLGWYYDDALTDKADPNDTVTKNMTLYAKMAESTAILSEETPNYITVSVPVVKVATYSFGINNYTSGSVASFTNVTNNNTNVEFTMDGSTVKPKDGFAQGQIYRIVLEVDSSAQFIVDGVIQPKSIRELNILTEKTEIENLTLNGNMKYLHSSNVYNMTGTALDGLFTVNMGSMSAGTLSENKNVGTFTYDGTDINVGDTVAIYSGNTRPDQRNVDSIGTDEDGAVAYVKITSADDNVYSYQTADVEEVLFVPDILPVPSSKDKDGDTNNNSITVDLDVMDFSDDKYFVFGLDSQTTVDAGDFIAFYNGELGSSSDIIYAFITSVNKSGEDYIITYEIVSEADVLAAMDLYFTRNENIELTQDEIEEIEDEIEEQAFESGFVEEAAVYLTALALETDGFQELSDSLDMDLTSYSIQFADGTPVGKTEMAVMGAKKAEITKKEISAKVAAGKALQHFKGKYGVRAELTMTFTIEIDGKIEINVQAIFEQEILLTVNTSGGAIWKWALFIPYIYDYNLNANIDIGAFTAIGITATAKTIAEEEDGYNWKAVTDYPAEQAIINIGKEITDLMEAKEEFLGEKLVDEDGNEVEWGGTNGGSLAEKYAAMLENADDTWVELFRAKIFSLEGTVDPLHILCFGIKADFVVSANMYVTMGMTYEVGVAKRYNFSIMLFHRTCTNETIDLEEAHYQFDFYVMGTAGIRAGIELEVAVGLFSLKLDSVGICAEVGAYARLWGYFYYHLRWSESRGKESSFAGAMVIEIGLYLTISFKAQLFSSKKLTYKPTLYDNEWPLLTIGSSKNVYDFAYEKDDPMLDIKVAGARSFPVPTALFDMNYMDMKTGELYGSDSDDEDNDGNPDNPAKSFDDATESNYIISFSNPKFSYDPKTNMISVNPGLSIGETCKVTITWKGGPLAFTTRSISRTLTIDWTDPENTFYIVLNANGGTSSVSLITATAGTPITQPPNPVRTGYTFAYWCLDPQGTQKLELFPTTMQVYPDKGITLYAKWNPNTNTKYTVEHYLQELNGTYTLQSTDSQIMTGTTDTLTSATARTNGIYANFDAKAITQEKIAPDGSTVIKVYYIRKVFTVSFTYGDLANEELTPLTYKAKYGSIVYVPMIAMAGYDFIGFQGIAMNEDGSVTVTGNKEYKALWSPRTDTPYRIEHYVQRTSGDGYLLTTLQNATGATDSKVTASNLKIITDGINYKNATVNGNVVTQATISSDGKTVIKLYYDRFSYNLIFMSDGSTYHSTTALYGSVIQSPAAPVKSGYTFSGWYENASFTGSPFSFENGPTMPNKNLTLYAKWTPREDTDYTVLHYLQNENGTYSTVAETEYLEGVTGSTVTATPMSFPHYTLDTSYAGTIASGTVAADGSLVLKLYYTRDTYTLTFMNGETVVSSVQVPHGAPINAPVLVKTGYILSWSPAVPENMPTENVTYTAVWTANDGVPYKTEYYLQNPNDDGYTLYETIPGSGKTDEYVLAPEKSYEHFTENIYHLERAVSGNITGEGDLVLKRFYDRDTFTVTFDPNGGELRDSAVKTFRYEQSFLVTDPEREDYAFAGWYIDGTKFDGTIVTNDMNLVAQWSAGAVNYSVEHYIMNTNGTYVKDYTQSASGIIGEEVLLSSLKISSYEKEDGIEYLRAEVGGVEASTATIAKGMTVALYYERKTHTLNWELNGGSDGTNGYTSGNVYYDSSITYPNTVKTGYTLEGWYTDSALSTEFTGNMPANSLTLYAKWKVNQYTITFNTDGGSAISAITQDYGTEVVPPASPTKDGYIFIGWDTPIPSTMPANNLTIKALWESSEYSIEYDLKGGTVSIANPTSYTITSDSFTLINPTRDGYNFAGWVGTGLSSATMTVTITKGSSGNRSYTATWTPISYGITYNLNSGTLTTANPSTYNIETNSFTLNNPTRTGYNFAGWIGTGLSSATTTVTITKGSTGERSYTATWTPITYTITYNGLSGATNDNPTTYTIEDGAFQLNEPVRSGYEFLGWTGTGLSSATKNVTITAGSTGNRTYTATWKVAEFTISSVNDLVTLRSKVSSGEWTNEHTAKLTANITLSPENWTSGIGTNSKPFKGTFDGNGYTITYNGGSTASQPIIANNSGTVKNVRVSLSGTIIATPQAYGVVVGYNSVGANIINCHVASNTTDTYIVKSAADYGTNTVGGIVGYNQGTVADCSIGRAVNNPLVIKNQISGAIIGGISGYNEADGSITFSSTFKNPYTNAAAIYVKLVSTAPTGYLGGISGSDAILIQFDVATQIYVTVQADKIPDDYEVGVYIGGIVGNKIGGTITGPTSSYVTVNTTLLEGYISESASIYLLYGGISGYCSAGVNKNIKVTTFTLPSSYTTGMMDEGYEYLNGWKPLGRTYQNTNCVYGP